MEVSAKGTVRDLKEASVEKAGITADEMRLIFKGKHRILTNTCVFPLGKILKDELTLEEYKIEDGVTCHLVKGKSAAASSAPTATTTTTTTSSTAPTASTTASTGVQQPPAGGLGGMPGLGGGFDMFGGMGGGFPNMAAGGGPSGMGGLGGLNMNPQMMQ